MANYTANEVQKGYIAFYGRPAEPSGLAYWMSVADSITKAQLYSFFADQDEYREYFDAFLDASDKITNPGGMIDAVYQHLFGHNADAAGKAWWSAQITSGAVTFDNAVVQIMNGAQNEDLEAVISKLAAANAFTAEAAAEGYVYDAADVPGAHAWLDAIVDADTLDAAVNSPDFAGDVKEILTGSDPVSTSYDPLTTAIDVKEPGEGVTVIGNENTFQSNDKIEGTDGKGKVDLGFDTGILMNTSAVIDNVASVSISSHGDSVLNASKWTNVGEIAIYNTTEDVQLDDLQATSDDANKSSEPGTVYSLDDVQDGTVTLDFDKQATDDAETLVELSVNEVTAGVVITGGSVETLKITIEDEDADYESTLAGLAVQGISTLEITGGAKGLDFGIKGALDAGLDVIDAASAKSNLSLDVSASTEDMTVDLGSGDDKICFGDTLNDGDSVDGGAGTDTVSVVITSTSPAIREPEMKSVEVLNAIFKAEAEFSAVNVTGLKTINLGLACDGKRVASTADVDFDKLKAETATVNIYANQKEVELDYRGAENVNLDINFKTDADDISINGDNLQSFRIRYVDDISFNNVGNHVADIVDGINLDDDTVTVAFTTKEIGGDLIITDADGCSSLRETASVETLTINALNGDVYAAGQYIDVADNHWYGAVTAFMSEAGELQDYTVIADDADVLVGEIGMAGGYAFYDQQLCCKDCVEVEAASELETITIKMLNESSLAQDCINAKGADINRITILASDKNTVYGYTNPNHLNNVFIGGLGARKVNALEIETHDRGDVEMNNLDFTLKDYKITGSGDIFLRGEDCGCCNCDGEECCEIEPEEGLVMDNFGVATNFTGTLYLIDGFQEDVLRGTNANDVLAIRSMDNVDDIAYGGAGNDTIVVAASAVQCYNDAGDAKVNGNEGNDLIVTLTGSPSETTIITSAGHDTVVLGSQLLYGAADCYCAPEPLCNVCHGPASLTGATNIGNLFAYCEGTDLVKFTSATVGKGQTDIYGFQVKQDELSFDGIHKYFTNDDNVVSYDGGYQQDMKIDSNTVYLVSNVDNANGLYYSSLDDFDNLTDAASFFDHVLTSDWYYGSNDEPNIGDTAVFIAGKDDGNHVDSCIYLFSETNGNGNIDASELTILGHIVSDDFIQASNIV